MVKLGCRPRNFSLTIVIILAISNMLLTFLLLQTETCTSTVESSEIENINKINTEKAAYSQRENYEDDNHLSTKIYDDDDDFDGSNSYIHIDLNLGRWDNHRIIKMFDSIIVGSKFAELSKSTTVCLATQSSVEKLHSLVQVAHHWTATISIAIYIAGDEEYQALQKYLIYLRTCYIAIRERVNFSIAIPRTKIPENFLKYEKIKNFNCSKPEATLASIIDKISVKHTAWRAKDPYPQNHMRNLARKNCQNDFILLTDVDIVPSIDLADSIDKFLRNIGECDKCAFVVPTYELDKRVKFPKNKTELVRLAKKGLARPFHWKVFIHNQYATNFTRWVQDVIPGSKGYSNVIQGKTYVCHNVTNFEFLYEPFYVAKDTVPPHDERFVGYGYTRNTQVYEMFIAGYQFQILSPVFTVHWGLQTRKGRLPWRERQNIINRKQFDQFKREIFSKYDHDTVKMLKRM